MFKKGDYIVPLIADDPGYTFARKSYVYKQARDHHYISPEKDSTGKLTIGDKFNTAIDYQKKSTWRYANNFEIALYSMENRPMHIDNVHLLLDIDDLTDEGEEFSKPLPDPQPIIHKLTRV